MRRTSFPAPATFGPAIPVPAILAAAILILALLAQSALAGLASAAAAPEAAALDEPQLGTEAPVVTVPAVRAKARRTTVKASAKAAAAKPAAPVAAKPAAAPSAKETAPQETVWTDPATGMGFVWVSGGPYAMGCAQGRDNYTDEGPVRVAGFWLGSHEVTQGQWRKVMGENPAFFKKGDNYPVEHVSLADARAFLARLNGLGAAKFRLPTETEWEYAARSGGKAEEYSGGSEPGLVSWHLGNSGGTPHEVGTKAPNALGLYDMSGNVWEWCEGILRPSAADEDLRDPAVGFQRGLRGGGWNDGPRGVCFARLGSPSPNFLRNDVGLRLVRIR